MTKLANIARYLLAILLPCLLVKCPFAGILTCFGLLWLNNYLDDILFYLSSLEVRNEEFTPQRIVSPVNGIVTKVERGVPSMNLKKRDALDTTTDYLEYDVVGQFEKRWKAYDHVAVFLNKFSKHLVLNPSRVVSRWKHFSDGNLEMVTEDSLVSDNVGEYMNNDALVVEYPNFIMVLTMDKYISQYIMLDESKGVCCQIMRGSQCDFYFKEGTFIYPKVGNCIDIYDPLAHVNTEMMSFDVKDEAKKAVQMCIEHSGGYGGIAMESLKKSLSTFKCLWLLCAVVILPLMSYPTLFHTFFSYVGFSSIYLFLFVRSYRHLMYSLMNVFGLKDWMISSYKFIAKAHKLWKK